MSHNRIINVMKGKRRHVFVGQGVKGRRVVWSGATNGEWIVRAVVGEWLRIRRSYGGMSFLVHRSTVKFVRRNYTAKPKLPWTRAERWAEDAKGWEAEA